MVNGFLHSAPLICLLGDFILNHFSFPYQHITLVLIFDVIYLTINLGKFSIDLAYSLAVKPVYRPIDWVSWGSYIIAVATLFLTIFIHFIGRVVHRKWKIHKRKREPLIEGQNRIESGINNQSLVEEGDL